MVDETTDITNKEQVTLVLRWVANDLSVSEEFVGLYVVDNIQALTLKAVIEDTLLRMNLSFKRIRGQCYDGASTMAGCRNGLAKLIQDMSHEPCIRIATVMLLTWLLVML